MSAKKIDVLLVEDDEDHACLIESAFDEHTASWNLTIVRSLAEARSQLANLRPQLVIVDLVLPDGRGTQLLPRHRELTDVPFVLMTSHGNEAMAVEAIKGGALEYVVKSAFSLAELPRTAERVLREWQLIVEQGHAREREKQLISQLAHAERRNTMGEMAATLAHEVNQPLTVIAAYASMCHEMLDRKQLDAKNLHEALSQIDQQARRAGSIVNGLKRFIAKVTPSASRMNLAEVIRDVGCFMRSTLQSRRTTLELEIDEDLPLVHIDPVQIQQVLVNLIQNALDAMEDVEPARRRVVLTAVVDADVIRISVSDCGHGFSNETLRQLFEPYFTTKHSGLGLGLSISQRIVEAHGGRLTTSQNSSEGATFEFTIPTLASLAIASSG
ncbi:MAG: ATP-binding protein [Planctomycetaceae bacterium]